MIALLLADDHTLLREGLKRLLHQTGDIVVEGEAGNGQEVLALLAQRQWDVLVLDMSMPGRDGIDLIRQIRAEHPEVPILVLTMHGEQQYAARAIKAGAAGYLTKDSAAEELVLAVRKVAKGGHFLSQALAESIAFERHGSHEDAPHLLLSDREFTVFQLLAEGLGNSEIAQRLFISVKTVSTYKARLFIKMHMRNQTDLVRYAIRHHLVNEQGTVNPRPTLPGEGDETLP
ncbi:DNA-binding NarL/FixJ family response regulator OS=Castellaniella defragrans OX=75697 GN=HNR28_001682 PE=4 SV=1 [Castellaniella defragrans]